MHTTADLASTSGMSAGQPLPPQPAPDTAQAPALLYIRGDQLMERDSDGREHVVFSDPDLEHVLGVRDGQAIAAFVADDGRSYVAAIALDGTGTRTDFPIDLGHALAYDPWGSAAYRPGTDTLSFITFDNAERSYGYALVTERLQGGGRQVIDQGASWLSIPAWSQDGTMVAYVKGKPGDDDQELWAAHNGADPRKVASFGPDERVISIAWQRNNLVAVNVIVDGIGASIITIRTDSGERQLLADLPGNETSLAISRDGAWLATVGDDGALFILGLPAGTQSRYGSASFVGAWVDAE